MKGDFILINNNNTRTKFALSLRDELLEHRSMETSAVNPESVADLLAGWSSDRVVMASVVPGSVPDLVASQEGREVVMVDHKISLGVEIDFPRPEQVGADRLANAAAVAERTVDSPVIVVDFGTAVTFDIVDRRPAYLGGVIAPGLDSMSHYLHQRTALLPRIEISQPTTAIGKSTEHAMQSGAFHGYRGLVVEIIRQIEKELGLPGKIVATGGYADLISRNLPAIHRVEPYLTMEGLRRIATLNF